MAGAGNVFISGCVVLTTGSDNSSTQFSGAIQQAGGAGSLVKNGTGTFTWSGVNTYLGTTTVNGGTLSVDGSIVDSSLTTVNAGATLGGNGTAGNTTINGGALAPGNSIGLLTVRATSSSPQRRATWSKSRHPTPIAPTSPAPQRSAARL